MEKETIEQLQKTYQAVRALHESLERALNTGLTEGIGQMAFDGYTRLRGRAVELLPDDLVRAGDVHLGVEALVGRPRRQVAGGDAQRRAAQSDTGDGCLFQKTSSGIFHKWTDKRIGLYR